MPDPYDISMDTIWTRTKYSKFHENRLEKSFIYHHIDHDRYHKSKEEWSPESMSLPDHIGDHERESCEHERDIAHERGESIEKCPIEILERFDDGVLEGIEGREEGHDEGVMISR
jgi:IS30 family transposase